MTPTDHCSSSSPPSLPLPRHPDLLKGVYGMGFNRPSKIQEKALPILLADPPCNLIAQSQSGTGKTAAFVLAMLSRVDPAKHYPQVCVCGGGGGGGGGERERETELWGVCELWRLLSPGGLPLPDV